MSCVLARIRVFRFLLLGCALLWAGMEQHLGAQTLAAGRAHSLYVDTNGYLWAWGANNAAQLGDVIKDQSNRLRPLRVGLETN